MGNGKCALCPTSCAPPEPHGHTSRRSILNPCGCATPCVPIRRPSHPTARAEPSHNPRPPFPFCAACVRSAVQRRPCLIVTLTACVEIEMIDRAAVKLGRSPPFVVYLLYCTASAVLQVNTDHHCLSAYLLPTYCLPTLVATDQDEVRCTPHHTTFAPPTSPLPHHVPPGLLHLIGIMRAVMPSASAAVAP